MEREEFKILVKAMKAVYAQPTFIPDKDAFDVWYGLLQDLPYEQAKMCIRDRITRERSSCARDIRAILFRTFTQR